MAIDDSRSACPRISVIVAAFNASSTIEACFDSVLGQDHTALELIVVDGGSTDGTVDIIARLAGRLAWWTSEPDDGVYDAWNKALSRVTGDWVIFLGADDAFDSPRVLAAMAPHLADAAGRYRVVYAGVDVVADDGSLIRRVGDPWRIARPEFRERMAIPHQGVFHHRSLFATIGVFDATYRITGDYELLLRELLEHDALFVPGLVVTRMGAGGLSDNPRTMARHVRETHRARYEHGLVGTPDWRSFEVFRATTHARLTQWFGRDMADRVGDAYRAVTRTEKKP